jgi:hypothetical protein
MNEPALILMANALVEILTGHCEASREPKGTDVRADYDTALRALEGAFKMGYAAVCWCAKCHTPYHLEGFRTLPLVGMLEDAPHDPVEMRHCLCGSTLGVVLPGGVRKVPEETEDLDGTASQASFDEVLNGRAN